MECGLVVILMQQLKLSSVTVFYDYTTVSIVSRMTARQDHPYRVTLLNANSTNDSRVDAQFRNAFLEHGTGNHCFLVVCLPSCVKRILQQANEYDPKRGKRSALGLFSTWIIYSSTSPVSHFVYGLDNLDNTAVITDENPHGTGMNDDKHGVWTIVGTKYGQRMWKKVTGDSYHRKEVFPNLNKGLNNRTLTVTTSPWPPLVFKATTGDRIVYTGYAIDVLDILAEALNFRYRLIEPPDGEWGAQVNGTWTGMVRQLNKEEVDLMAAPMFQSEERETVIDFIFPCLYDYTTAIYKQSQIKENALAALFGPFHWILQLCIAAATLWTVLILMVVERLNPFYGYAGTCGQLDKKRSTTPDRNTKARIGLLDGITYVVSGLFRQSSHVSPSSTTGSIVAGMWMLFSVSIAASYGSKLVSTLLVTKLYPPFTTLSELVHQTVYSWGTVRGSVWQDMFEFSNKTEYQEVWSGIQAFKRDDVDVLSQDREVQFAKVIRGNYAFIADGSLLRKWRAARCDLFLLEERVASSPLAFGLPDQSDLRQMFSLKMAAMLESGVLELLQRRWFHGERGCGSGNNVNGTTAINLNKLSGLFILISICIGCALTTLLLEIGVGPGRLRKILLIFAHRNTARSYEND